MARPKAFDRDRAVAQAMVVFWERGYEATSTDDLLRAMGIGRQSMYDTFGDKHSLYLEALAKYQEESGEDLFRRLRNSNSPLEAIEDALVAVAEESPETRKRGCMAVNAAAEFGQTDPSVATLLQDSARICEAAFERAIREAKAKGEVAAAVNERQAGQFLLATMRGLRLSSKAGASPETLRNIAAFALAGLRA